MKIFGNISESNNRIKCKNPRCITSVEQELTHEFRLVDAERKLYRCVYCESEAPRMEK